MTCSCDNAGDDQVRNFAPGGDERDAQSALGQACEIADYGGTPDHAVGEYEHPNNAADVGQPTLWATAHERKVKVFLSKKVRHPLLSSNPPSRLHLPGILTSSPPSCWLAGWQRVWGTSSTPPTFLNRSSSCQLYQPKTRAGRATHFNAFAMGAAGQPLALDVLWC